MPPAIVTGSYDPDDAMETTSLLATRSREGSVVGGGNHRDGSIIEIVAETVIEVIDLRDPSKVNNSPYATIMMLLNTAIAACFVAQPYIFMTAGVGSTIAEYIFINIGIYTGVEVLLVSAARVRIFDYSDLAVKAFGEMGSLYVDVAIIFVNGGIILANILLIGSLLQAVEALYGVDSNAIYFQEAFLSGMVLLTIVFPLCLIRNFGHLAWVSVIGFFTIASIVFLVLIYGPLESATHASDPINYGDGIGTITTMGDVVFNFWYAMAVFHAYGALKAPRAVSHSSERRGDYSHIITSPSPTAGYMSLRDDNESTKTEEVESPIIIKQKVELFLWTAAFATVAAVAVSLLMGLGGYLSFRSTTQVDVLDNVEGTLGAVFKTVFALFLTLDIPMYFIVLRHSVLNLCGIHVADLSSPSFILATVLLLGFIATVALLLQIYSPGDDNLEVVLDLTGGIAGSAISFLLPGFIGLALVPDPNAEKSLDEEEKDYHDGGTLAADQRRLDRGVDVDCSSRGIRYKAMALIALGFSVPILVIISTIYKHSKPDSGDNR